MGRTEQLGADHTSTLDAKYKFPLADLLEQWASRKRRSSCLKPTPQAKFTSTSKRRAGALQNADSAGRSRLVLTVVLTGM